MNYYVNTKEPRRGDIFYITHAKNFNNGITLDTTGRPDVIVSSDELNKNSDYIEVVYLTTQEKKPMPTHASVHCKSDSTALCETIHTVEKGRLGNYVRTVSDEEMDGIEHGLNWSLGLYKKTELKSVNDDDFEPGPIKLAKMDTDFEQVQKSIQLSAERDMYKKLYEDLLAKVIK